MTDWIIRPGELMPERQTGFGVWDGKTFHDGERGGTFGKATMTQPHNGLCPHKLNPANCLQCYHASAAAPPPPKPQPRRGPAVQTNPIVAAVKQRAGVGEGPMGQLVPHVDAPVHLGKTLDGKDIVPPKRESTRGPMPKPVLYPQNAQGGQGALTKTLQPFSYESNAGRVDSKGLWHPQRRESLVDRLPSHPEAPPKR